MKLKKSEIYVLICTFIVAFTIAIISTEDKKNIKELFVLMFDHVAISGRITHVGKVDTQVHEQVHRGGTITKHTTHIYETHYTFDYNGVSHEGSFIGSKFDIGSSINVFYNDKIKRSEPGTKFGLILAIIILIFKIIVIILLIWLPLAIMFIYLLRRDDPSLQAEQ